MSMLAESLVFILFRAGLFVSCRSYVLDRLYSNLETISTAVEDDLPMHVAGRGTTPSPPTHSTISRAVFALCFSESCMLFVLLMLQGLGIFDPKTRLIHWIISLHILLLTILILNPLIISSLVTSRSRKHPFIIRLALSVIPFCIYLFFLSRIPLPSALVGLDLMSTSLARLVVLGTIILGLLSGFGAVSSSWVYLSTRMDKELGIPSERDIELAERALERVREDLIARKHQLEAGSLSSADGTSPSSSASWYSRLVPTLRSSALSDTKAEVTGLQMVYSQMEQKLFGLKRRKEDEAFRKTVRGRLYGFVAVAMAIYWMARIVWTSVNVLVYRNLFSPETSPESTTNYPDIISKLVGNFILFIQRHRQAYSDAHDLVGDEMDNLQLTKLDMDLDSMNNNIALVTRHLSLLFVGLVILTSIRTVLRGVSRVLSHSSLEGRFKLNSKSGTNSRSLGASLMVIILAQLMGVYLISTIVQLRTSFPPPAAGGISSTLSFSTFSSYTSSFSTVETLVSSSYPSPSTTVGMTNETSGWHNQTSSRSTTQTQNLFTTIPSFHPAVFASLFDGSFLLAVGISGVGRWVAGRLGGWDE